jgi:hypothetical protein
MCASQGGIQDAHRLAARFDGFVSTRRTGGLAVPPLPDGSTSEHVSASWTVSRMSGEALPVERTAVGSEGRATYRPKARGSSFSPMAAVGPEGARAMTCAPGCLPIPKMAPPSGAGGVSGYGAQVKDLEIGSMHPFADECFDSCVV